MMANRPGRSAISYRIGTFTSFLAAMKNRLSSADYPGLADLRTRDSGDWSIALLDGWASVADILTFYQERIANEGFVRTATQRLSVLEIGRTVGYALRPGVSATAYVAYTMDATADSTIQVGTRSQSTPAQGQMPQSFETADPLHATGDWSVLGVRTAQPQKIDLSEGAPSELVFQGANLNLKTDDVLLIVDPNNLTAVLQIVSVETKPAAGQTNPSLTHVNLRDWLDGVASSSSSSSSSSSPFQSRLQSQFQSAPPSQISSPASAPSQFTSASPSSASSSSASSSSASSSSASPSSASSPSSSSSSSASSTSSSPAPSPSSSSASSASSSSSGTATNVLDAYAAVESKLVLAPAIHPPNALQLKQQISIAFEASDRTTDAITKALTVLNPELETTLVPALQNAVESPAQPVDVYAFRVNAAPFGANAPLQLAGFTDGQAQDGTSSSGAALRNIPNYVEWAPLAKDEGPDTVFLDRYYPLIVSGGYVAIFAEGGQAKPAIATIESVDKVGRAAYGISGTTSKLIIRPNWYDDPKPPNLAFLRGRQVYAQSEKLTLADLAIEEPVQGLTIELDDVYDGLDSGRWLIVSGKRTDVSGVPAAELVMLLTTRHTVDKTRPGDKLHTTLALSDSLSYAYDRKTVQVYGNVVRATHGETRTEILGSGDGGSALQKFTLKASPLTYVSVPTQAGVQSTLQITVNGLSWTESASFDSLGPHDRGYITQTDNKGMTSVIFGDGVHGARLPTGVENVAATYRVGIGRLGNVDAGQLTLLASKPLGVRSVTNPLPASGGADPEDVNQGRANVPVATASLDRIVSVADYAAVARTFAGVAKAAARWFPGSPPIVHVTIAADDDAAVNTPVVTDLVRTLTEQGDPTISLDVKARSLVILVLAAYVAVQPGNQWETVSPAIRARLLDVFGFGRRALAQDVYLAEIVAAITGVEGVAYVQVETFTSISDVDPVSELSLLSTPGPPKPSISANPPLLSSSGTITAAQLAIFKAELPDAMVLQLI
jgi:predicted phage baseplate assembly protein